VLTFELSPTGDEIQIHCDAEGVQTLIRSLARLAQKMTSDHDHLMTPSWAGHELTDEKQGQANRLVNMVTIYYRPRP
jgi:hypothetical protein